MPRASVSELVEVPKGLKPVISNCKSEPITLSSSRSAWNFYDKSHFLAQLPIPTLFRTLTIIFVAITEMVKEKLSCFHCGNDCPPQAIHFAQKDFCCDGCATVFSLLSDFQLGEYYKLNQHPGSKASGQQWVGKFDFLDEEETFRKVRDFSNERITKITFSLPAIHCSSCIWLLEKLFRFREGILQSEINFLRKEAYVTFDHHKIKLSEVAELLASLGYAPQLSLENLGKKAAPKTNRMLWFKLGVAGFCFGNIMLLSFPEYLGIDDSVFAKFFSYANLVFALPVLLFSSQDYFRSAINGLRNRQINMDVPLALGMMVLFGRSSFEVITQTGAGYFDSFAGLIFFLLLGKAFQARTWDALSFDRDYKSYLPISVTVKRNDAEKIIPLSDLKAGMILIARNGELIPADGKLLNGKARMDYSFVTGETEPVKIPEGGNVFAGGKQNGPRIEVEVSRQVSQSYLARLWNNEAFDKHRESEVTKLATRVGRNFTIRLLIIAAGAAAFWLWYQPVRTAEIVTAILIVACPCALAISTPFTLGNVLRILGRNGFYLKGAAAVEQLAEADSIVFDKTGTLTQAGSSAAEWNGKMLSESNLQRISSLANQSFHPLSRRLLMNLPQQVPVAVEDFKEVPGMGISGNVMGTQIALGKESFVAQCLFATHEGKEASASQDGSEIWIGIGNEILGKYVLRDQFRENISEMLPSLGSKYKLAILSGDNDRERERLAAMLPSGSEMRFSQNPEDKLNFIKARQKEGAKVVMIGDGLNDAGALRQSDAGISVSEASGAFTPGSDAILDSTQIPRLGDFLNYSRKSIRIIRASFLLSLVYNTTGIAFAITGHLSPLVAAILMPMSSISVIAFTAIATNLAARRLKL